MAVISYQSPAKLNLFLHITGQRNDGYHELQTVFQLIGLYDDLSFEVTSDKANITLDSCLPFSVENNLMVKAARCLQRKHEISSGVRMTLKKRIPMGGGLGGGSSNAATTLLALNRLWGLMLSEEDLCSIAVTLGADVPVFVKQCNAFAEGVGEQLYTVNLPKRWYIVAKPDCHVATAPMFQAPGLIKATPKITLDQYLQDGINDVQYGMNVFEEIALDRYPVIKETFSILSQYGKPRLTGTGACVFLAFNQYEDAKNALTKIQLGDAKGLYYLVEGV